jgi:hypothetical protein
VYESEWKSEIVREVCVCVMIGCVLCGHEHVCACEAGSTFAVCCRCCSVDVYVVFATASGAVSWERSALNAGMGCLSHALKGVLTTPHRGRHEELTDAMAATVQRLQRNDLLDAWMLCLTDGTHGSAASFTPVVEEAR